jgi:DNA-binding FadR family transcriptional regulator
VSLGVPTRRGGAASKPREVGDGAGSSGAHGQNPAGDAPEKIAQELRRLLVSGEIASGGVLQPITKLMARFGVSRPTLRSALRILENEKLVRVRRGSRAGIRVLEPSMEAASRVGAQTLQAAGANLGDLYDARLMIEPAAIRMLAERRDVRDIAQLRAFLRRLDAAIQQNDAVAVAAESARFHTLIVELTGNKVLALVSGLIASVLERHQVATRTRPASPAASPSIQPRGVKSVKKLAALIEAGEADDAEKHWRAHLTSETGYWLKVQDRFETINVFS